MVGVVVVKNEFPRLALELGVKTEAVAVETAAEIAQGAADRSAVRTGALRDSWHSEAIVVSSPIRYAGYQEYGTRKMAPHPMLQPAVEAEAPRFEAKLKAALAI